MRIYSKIDIGKERSVNQDAFFAGEISEDIAFAVVCDGMGGANAGEIASQTAVKTISEYIINSYRRKITIRDFLKILKNAITSANITVYDMAQKDENLSGMGTTVVVAVVKGNEVAIAHVGDSRIYLVNDEITQLTRDHSVVQTLIESGKITPEDAKVHPRKNVITRAIGAENDIIADTSVAELDGAKALLLCTDGLSSYVNDETILKVFKENEAKDVPNKLIELANMAGGGDNITVVLIML